MARRSGGQDRGRAEALRLILPLRVLAAGWASRFSQVLGSGGEVELVFCAAGASETQAVELEDAFAVREQHLDLFRSRREVRLAAVRQMAGEVAGAFVGRA